MNKNAVLQLRKEVVRAAELFSNTGRDKNFGREEFFLDRDSDIVPLSDDVAAVLFTKTGGKRVLFLFYYLHMRSRDGSDDEGVWRYFSPTDSHLLGMRELDRLGLKQSLERENFPLNQKTIVVKT